jgi:nicotinate-nucleotide adenylyltransferase
VKPQRVGIFGGTFDPPHWGHLLLAESAREELRLDRVLFVPARVPPHKTGDGMTPANVRLRLLRAALRGTGFEISQVELGRPGPSYTVDTLEALRRSLPGAALFLLVGADSLADLPTWRAPERIARLATVAVARRPGSPDATRRAGKAFGARIVPLGNPPVDLASNELRARVARGRSIRFRVPPAVERLVHTLGLYRSRRARPGPA